MSGMTNYRLGADLISVKGKMLLKYFLGCRIIIFYFPMFKYKLFVHGWLFHFTDVVVLCIQETGPSIVWLLIGYGLAYMNLSIIWIFQVTLLLIIKRLENQVEQI